MWVNKEKIQGKSFGNFFILVMTADIEARVALEDDLAAIATARGYKAVKSLELLPFNLSDPKIPAKEDVVKKIKASGCDAVFIASVINKNDTVRYEPGHTAYTVMPNYSFTGNYYDITAIGIQPFPLLIIMQERKLIFCRVIYMM